MKTGKNILNQEKLAPKIEDHMGVTVRDNRSHNICNLIMTVKDYHV